MHLLDRYALSTGSRVKLPYLQTHFYPTPEKYITIQNSSGMPGKNYPYYAYILNFIIPTLLEHGIQVVQIGAKEDAVLPFTIPLQGRTTLAQTFFILKNSLVHLGNDSFSIHACSAMKVPYVGLYSVSAPEVCGGYWTKYTEIMAPIGENKPSYNPNENPSVVKNILPETIITALEKYLQIPLKKPSSIFFGDRCTDVVLEVIPNQVVDPNFFKDQVLNLRLDLLDEFNPSLVQQNLNNRPCVVLIDKPFDPAFLLPVRKNLRSIFVILEKELSADMLATLKNIKKNGLPMQVVFRGDEEKLPDIKLEMMDIAPTHYTPIVKRHHDITEYTHSATNRLILSDGKIHTSIQAWRENKATTTNIQPLSVITDKEKLFEESEYFYLYNFT